MNDKAKVTEQLRNKLGYLYCGEVTGGVLECWERHAEENKEDNQTCAAVFLQESTGYRLDTSQLRRAVTGISGHLHQMVQKVLVAGRDKTWLFSIH